jgi:predicted DCC family thiol-disulfide oxidoreductase YuxK
MFDVKCQVLNMWVQSILVHDADNKIVFNTMGPDLAVNTTQGIRQAWLQ